jgi:putative restriction endonuclease
MGTPGRVFGHISGVPVGAWYATRDALAAARVHPPTQAGISYSVTDGADSIVASGGYEDDQDYGDVLVYTGMGGNDPATRKQDTDQTLDRGSLRACAIVRGGFPLS